MDHKTTDNILTLEERLNLAARSEASSQEAATAMVKHFSSIHAVNIFAGKPDITLLYELATQELDSDMDLDVDHYKGFCRLFATILHNDNNVNHTDQPRGQGGPIWGVRANNVLILLGLMMYDQLRDRWNRHEIYNCTRMTLAQYLAAVVELAPDFKIWADRLLEQHDGSLSLTQTLENILRIYIDGWSKYALWDHIAGLTAQACMCDPEKEKDEIDKLLQEAQNSELELPDIFDPETPARAIREQLYLQDRNYSKATFQRLTELAPYPGFKTLLAHFTDGDVLDRAMGQINLAVMDIYLLFAQAFASMTAPNT